MLSVPDINLGHIVWAASAEFKNASLGLLTALNERVLMLNDQPEPEVITTLPNHLFPKRVNGTNNLAVQSFNKDYCRFALMFQQFIKRRPKGFATGTKK